MLLHVIVWNVDVCEGGWGEKKRREEKSKRREKEEKEEIGEGERKRREDERKRGGKRKISKDENHTTAKLPTASSYAVKL